MTRPCPGRRRESSGACLLYPRPGRLVSILHRTVPLHSDPNPPGGRHIRRPRHPWPSPCRQRRPRARGAGRVRGAGERRQRDRRGGRRHPHPRGGVQRPGERGGGRADDHPARRHRGGGHHRRGRRLAARPRPRCVHRTPRGRDPARGTTHGGTGRPRCVPPGPGALGHDDVPRRGGARGALRILGLPPPPRDARLRAPVRGRPPALAGERRNLDAGRRGPGAR